MESDGSTKGTSWRWPLLTSIAFLNICLPSLVLSYGVLLVEQVNLHVPIWLGLLAPTIFIVTYSLTQCWCREAADSWGGPIGFRVMAVIGLAAILASLAICAFIPLHIQPYVYGVLGGFGSSLISAQVDAVVYDSYDTQLGLVKGLCFAGQAVGQALFPHILTLLIDKFEYSLSFLVLSGIMFQTLPAILVLKIDEGAKRPVSFSRYSDVSKSYIYNNEGMDNTYYTTVLQLHDMSKKCWKSPSDDNLHRECDHKINDGAYDGQNATITPPPSPEEKRRNIFGVEILPDIPEESEESDSENDYFSNSKRKNNNKSKLSIAIKRLSTLGDNLDDCISNQHRRDSESDGNDANDSKDYTNVEVTYDNISPVTDIQREKILNSFSYKCQSAYASMRRRMWMPSYKVYRIRRRSLYFVYTFNDTFIKPLTRSLSCWRFYPSLALAFIKLIFTAVPLVLLPLIGSKIEPNISPSEINFLMTLYAFTWMCFLLCTPWLSQTPKRNFQYIVLIGLIFSTAACFVLAEASNHDMFSIGIVIAGFGYGAISSCWETTVQDFVGPRKWPKIHSTLETLSGCLLLGTVLGFSFVIDKENGLQLVMFIIAISLSVITFIWFLVVAVSIYNNKIRSSSLGRKWLLSLVNN